MNRPTEERGGEEVFDQRRFERTRGLSRLRGLFAAWRRPALAEGSAGHRPTDIATQLAGLSASLAEATRQTDPDFMQLAGDLKALYSCAAELSRTTGGHVNSIRAALEHSRLTGPDGLAARSLEELRNGLAEADRDLKSLAEVAGAMGRLHAQGQQMERIAMFLKASGCNFAVESARTAACQQAFGAFVEELRQLGEKIRALGEAIDEQAAATRTELVRLIKVITTDLAKLQALTQRSETTIRHTSEKMQQLLDSSWSALQQAEARTRHIARHADDAVYHLQFGDIVRQKLEHVVSAFEEVAKSFASGNPSGAAQADHILAVQSGQLELIHAEILSARDQLASAFTGLAGETSQLVSSVQQLGESNDASAAGVNLFENLKADLLLLGELQLQGRHLCEQARLTSQQAVDAASQLSRHLDRVQEINREMHLQALNAIIKTALLGNEGQTLGVLSTHVHAVFQDSNGLVMETVQVLERITAQTSRSESASPGAGENANSELHQGLEQLSRVHEEFRQTTASAVSLAQDQNARVEQAHGRLEFLSAFAAHIASLVGELADLRAALAPMKGSAGSSDALVPLSDRYTMESEREVHRRLAVAAGVAPAPASTSQASPAIENNMEFFDTPSAPPAISTSERPRATTPPLAAPVASGAKKDAALDDNIELF